ncbi:MAG: hypothetical protein GWN00_06610 [Aliifodinibius sp.]|nr:hypothetical protein [Fodinibius sp.]NIY24488.1 hypothetical protein [Fodinibius sp.]
MKASIRDGFTGADYDSDWHDAVKGIGEKLADYFRSQNPFFIPQVFMKACGFDAEQKWKSLTMKL